MTKFDGTASCIRPAKSERTFTVGVNDNATAIIGSRLAVAARNRRHQNTTNMINPQRKQIKINEADRYPPTTAFGLGY
jgi:hypothetical protein